MLRPIAQIAKLRCARRVARTSIGGAARADLLRATPLTASRQLEWINRHSQLHVATPFADKSPDPTFLFAPPSQLWTESKLAVCGGLMAIIPSSGHNRHYCHRRVPAGRYLAPGRPPSYDPLASWLSRPARLELRTATPRLIVQSSRVSSGEPMPLGVALRGRAEGAVVIIKGLLPGMDLSAGNAVGTDAWQLLATDLGDAWIAPPEGFRRVNSSRCRTAFVR